MVDDTRRHRLARFLVALALAGAAGRCGGGESPGRSEPAREGGATTASTACTLLSAEEIEEALGTAPAGEPAAEDASCTWSDAAGSRLVRVRVGEALHRSFQDFVTMYTQEVGEEPGDRFRPVDGLGDWAMVDADEGAVHAYVGERVVEITVGPSGDLDAAVELARRALARLEAGPSS